MPTFPGAVVMGADWIKYQVSLPQAPEVFGIAAATRLDRWSVVGRLMALWAWAGEHTADGFLPLATVDVVDDMAGRRGFAEAMIRVGWLAVEDGGLRFPNWDRHNSKSAKERALNQRRMAAQRVVTESDNADESMYGQNGDGGASGAGSVRIESAQVAHGGSTRVRTQSAQKRHQSKRRSIITSTAAATAQTATLTPAQTESQSEWLARLATENPGVDVDAHFREFCRFCRRKRSVPTRPGFAGWLRKIVPVSEPEDGAIRAEPGPEGWEEVCRSRWPDASIPAEFHLLPTATQREVREALRAARDGGGGEAPAEALVGSEGVQ